MSDRTTILANPRWVAPLCWSAILMDGYDAVVLGTVIPTLLRTKQWGITTAGATVTATAGLVGMMVGGLSMGYLTDRFGRRKMLLAAVTLFSVFTFLMAFAPNLPAFVAFRFLAGLGLGGCLPTAIAMVGEFAQSHRQSNATTTLMTGYHFGAMVTAGLAIWVVANLGWPAMFWMSIIPAAAIVALMWRFLPESPSYLAAHGRHAEAETVARHYGIEVRVPAEEVREFDDPSPTHPHTAKKGIALLLDGPYARNSVAIMAASFMGLLLVYGLNTWLPEIMRAAQYDLGNALGMLMILNLGAILGLAVGGRVADRRTPRLASVAWFTASAVFLAALTIRMGLGGIYVMILLTGFFVFSSQVLVYAFTSTNYPPEVRATALGMSAGVGRIGAISGPLIGGFLLDRGLAYPGGFFVFAAVGLLGALAMLFTRTLNPRQVARATQ